ncbi:hypothetical protein [Nocardioides nitrophenolicus]|uniref:hypothetical protein n=1 Tax=Nocardioides nitrophenolicus TaxID=60489 RepID=UPI00195D3ECA|nr:hypothetical protein [Nocardioides nitrophenolicus]MBM7516974.1 hypothetical protein [Nocardioides nitrophenolicus]
MAAAVCLAACGGQQAATKQDDGPRPLTNEQAQALAVVRFNNYSAGTIRLEIKAQGTVDMDADVLVDLRVHAAYGSYQATDPATSDPVASGVIAWSAEQVGTASGDDPAQVPKATAWSQRAMDSSQPLDVALALALQLGDDRPENPVLLQQSSARLLRTEGKGEDRVWVMTGPGSADGKTESRTTYWVDATGHLERMEARIGSGDPAVFTVEEAPAPDEIPAKVLRFLRRA